MTRPFSLVLLVATCTLVGCGGGDTAGQQPVFSVSGTVTMFDAPLADATVAFAPQAGQPTAIGRTDKEGKFELTTYDYGDGAAAGAFNVVLSKSVPAKADSSSDDDEHDMDNNDDDGHSAEAAESGDKSELIPQQYTSSTDTPFHADVKTDGDNNFTFEVK
jgi:hypothetical protein